MREFLNKTADLNRSIVSDDFEKTLEIINKRIPLKIFSYPSGKLCFDWEIPKKWVIRGAYIKDESGKKIVDFKDSPLHVVTGSLPINKRMSREELLKKVYVSEKYPETIPYVFKFYELDWGFCMTKKQKDSLKGNFFDVAIDSEYVNGNLLVGEHIIKGESDKSIVLLSHIDHPGQVNDGLAGAAVMIRLAEMLKGTKPALTLRFQFLSERIGSIAYLSQHYKQKDKILGGIFCEMPGTPKYPMVLQYSRNKSARLDRAAKYVLEKTGKKIGFGECFRHVANDDAFYNSPGVDIPCISLSRSKPLVEGDWYHFPYYHTSGDNIKNFDFKQAEEYLEILKEIISIIDKDRIITRNYVGVPHLSRHKLWIDWRLFPKSSRGIYRLLEELDNGVSIFDLSEKCGVDFEEAYEFIKKMEKSKLVKLSLIKSI
ncbi:MAG: DUF4910 domain-containing protein [Candidatus Pacebacteria bacterium]|nr:DUF4910 domain-containing protein [Candidatus Paceibacterota bacterium]